MRNTAVTSVRRRTRATALQALYEADAVRHESGRALEDQLDALDLPEHAREFARQLVRGVLANRGEIDKIIAEFATAWPIGQMAVVDRNVLRIAIYEMIMGTDTPPKVAINEAVELAKRFGSDNSPRFVNGVLGAVMTVHRERLA